MKISQLINELQRVAEKHGDITVTCTACLQPDTKHGLDGKPFETTVENLVVDDAEPWGKKVRLYL